MIYPENFELKIGMDRIREIAKGFCLYDPGREEIDRLYFSSDPELIQSRLRVVEEFRQILISEAEFPLENFIDFSPGLTKARVPGRFLEEFELVSLKKGLESVRAILNFLNRDEKNNYPGLKALASEVKFFPAVHDRLSQLISKQGTIRDNASPQLASIRSDLRHKEASISKILNKIFEKARRDGIVDEDASISIRNGRAVIPIAASFKRRLQGYVHDESATGRTVYIEPSEAVEANNELRELENLERREVVKILTEFTNFLRPYIDELLLSHLFLARVDSIRARARFSRDLKAFIPRISAKPEIEWNEAKHPLLVYSFRAQNREKDVVPLDLKLDPESRILVISGPNAGGKSVCLQTVGLLQYMFQTGFPVPAMDSSTFGIFDNILLDMGDEQSIEDDLSTYSSHLLNMKSFLKNAEHRSLILIDEFGSGTEPALGAAIAESVLENLNNALVYGVITTHYTNLKHLASSSDGMVNGAMLFDTQLLKPLYRLSMGKPGSSFAFEIARKIGLPEPVLKNAEEKVGQDHVDFDRHLKDIIRDKRYWENKRQHIRVSEKRLDELVEKYDTELKDTDKLRKRILKEATEKAEALLAEANRKIENTIRGIREAEAEKEKTKSLRKELEDFKEQVKAEPVPDNLKKDAEDLQLKLAEVRKRSRQIQPQGKAQTKGRKKALEDEGIRQGDKVRMKGQDTAGEVLKIKGNKIEVAFGSIKTNVTADILEKIPDDEYLRDYRPKPVRPGLADWDVGSRQLRFSPDIDIRGKRADEALRIIMEFIDEAVMVQAHDLRILHGKGNGILRELIRQQLFTIDVVEWFGDEHVERGGAGITLVRLSV